MYSLGARDYQSGKGIDGGFLMTFTSHAKRILLAATAAALCPAAPSLAQEAERNADDSAVPGNDIIVTARRTEERLQDVPISITVLSPDQLNQNNITTAKDITTYTPGLVAQGRNGPDSVAFTIRGFSQEQRTTATVGTYFAEVVLPRGSGHSPGGDGAGPGLFFDLENVQVLKGPQGTLFGRNSTGGAVLLVPRKPTNDFEGYVEASAGNYDMRRLQAVANIPVMDSLRLRLGADHLKRDGYLKNVGNLGTGKYGDDMGSSDYISLRLSAVADLSPDIENYTIVSFVDSKSSPVIPKVIRAWNSNPAAVPGQPALPLGSTPCVAPANNVQCAQFLREQGLGKWAVSNSMADTASLIRQWQLINTTTWQINDDVRVKNIFSYAEFKQTANQDLFGNYWIIDGVTPGTERPENVQTFAYTHAEPLRGRTHSQSTMVEELQFQGNGANGRLFWQAGFYLESSDPLGFSGVQTAILTPCIDINVFNCRPAGGPFGIGGTGSFSIAKTKFRGRAVYGQASFDITDSLKFTAGARYTWDKMTVQLQNETWRVRVAPATPAGTTLVCTNFSAPGFGQVFTPAERYGVCRQTLRQKSEAPTWTLGLDFKPWDDALLYAKWSRGYRQGGLTIFGADPIQPYGEERVDTYEAGAKISWRGGLPGYFNISGYYNDFQDQQLQSGTSCEANLPNFRGVCAPTTAIVNAGKSRLYGFEAEVGLSPFEGLRINAAYAYLNTKILDIPTVGDILALLPPTALYNNFALPLAGDPLNFAMPHKLSVNAQYTLPLPEDYGRLSIGGTYVYQSKYRAVADACRNIPGGPCNPLTPGANPGPGTPGFNNGIVPSAQIVNLNLSWQDVMSLPIDATVFVTNVFNERYFLHINDQFTRSNVAAVLAEPRMWGVRLRYKFGQ